MFFKSAEGPIAYCGPHFSEKVQIEIQIVQGIQAHGENFFRKEKVS